jgi:hypothetical protein
MFYYLPPKSAIWGHRLGRLTANQARGLLRTFLECSVAHQVFQSATLHDGAELVPLFDRQTLVDVADTPYAPITFEDSESAIEAIVEYEKRTGARPQAAFVAQQFFISAWRVLDRVVPTDSRLTMHYGSFPCVSTFFNFDSIETFEHVRESLSTIGLCRLNPKHLKPVRSRKPKKFTVVAS